MAGLRLNHITKVYDNKVKAVSDVTLEIKDKEFVVFVGPSGCGKSTTLRMIAGLENISSGDLFIGDKRVNALEPKERNISMVFQNYALFPNMNVYDNISFGLRMHGEDKQVIRQKVTEVAEMLGLTAYLSTKPANLSGGQRQRVALGRAMVRNPDVFLLDEPLSNLDAKLRAKMRTDLLELHRKVGTTFIYVTHDQVEAMTMGDRIVVMKDGVLMQQGSPKQLYNYPENKFTASFIGTPQMNLVDATVARTDNGAEVQAEFGSFALNDVQLARLVDFGEQSKSACLGIRPEDIFVGAKPSDATNVFKISATVTDVEYMGSYALVYVKTAGETELIAHGPVEMQFSEQQVDVYLNTDKIHLFDAETEQTLLPAVPKHCTVVADVEKGSLILGGKSQKLPPALKNLPDGKVTLLLPPYAVVQGGKFAASCNFSQSTDSGNLCLLQTGNQYLFAFGDYPTKSTFGLDYSAVTFVSGEQEFSALSQEYRIPFVYSSAQGEDNGKKITKHFVDIGSQKIETYYNFNTKMYRLGRKVFDTAYVLGLRLPCVRLASDNEVYPTICATVCETLDYGDKKYLILDAEGNRFALLTGDERQTGETVSVAVDFDNCAVYNTAGELLFD